MSHSSIDGKLKGLEERLENEMRNRREGGFHTQGGLGAPRPGSERRPRPPAMFNNNGIQAFPPRSAPPSETEHRMREVYKMSGELNIGGTKYRSSIGDLQHLGDLGSGTCGHVVKMLHKPSAAVIAVKQMRRSGNSEETKRILMDLDVVVRSHDCPYIVRSFGCFVTDADVWICMELMASCFDKLLKRVGAPIPEPILGKVTVATVKALSYLKDNHGVIHRDVKPSNILIDERGNVKLCDFGISGRLVDSKAKTRSAGCAAYMAPERIDPPNPARPDYDIRADVWSLGISLVELATGVFPYRDCQNDFEVLTRVIKEDPPQLPGNCDFTQDFKQFVSLCLTKNYMNRPKYAKLLEHSFVVKSEQSKVSVEAWYAALPTNTTGNVRSAANSTGSVRSITNSTGSVRSAASSTGSIHSAGSAGSVRSADSGAASAGCATPTGDAPQTPQTPQPQRNYVTSAQFWMPEQVTPTPTRARWAAVNQHAGGCSSQPASLEAAMTYSPHQRRRTIDACASPPPVPARRVSADQRWGVSPQSSGNTSPIVLQRFYHQRKSRIDLQGTPRHRSLSREPSAGRSPEPPPRLGRPPAALHAVVNGSVESEPTLHERLQPHPSSPLLLHRIHNERLLSEGRSQSLTRAEVRNGFRTELTAPVQAAPKLHHEEQTRRPHLPHHHHTRWGTSESWSVPASPLPPRAPPPRPGD